MVDEILQRRAKWLSRRGLLELDIMLSKFVASPLFETLNNEELSVYIRILDWQDHDFLQTLQGIKSHNDPDIINIIHKIQSCSRID
ncbi:succinate dehydrogenase assembly factor 2 family protein [Neisseriaceae bacterium PsAf]|nr:succinate dehydrogenase assembly factor 2 family protein [Neisseriaceae bacterium PsAf]MCV2502678.1 succinate dehydrogenase assembly factor 2 [Neisseriaceae bacterium]